MTRSEINKFNMKIHDLANLKGPFTYLGNSLVIV